MQLSTAIPYMPLKYREMTKIDTHKDWTRPDPRVDPTHGQLWYSILTESSFVLLLTVLYAVFAISTCRWYKIKSYYHRIMRCSWVTECASWIADVGLAMVAVGCVTLSLVLLGCLLGLLIIRWQRTSSCSSADDESRTDEAAESRRIVTRDGEIDTASSGGWLRRVLSRARRTVGAKRDDRCNHWIIIIIIVIVVVVLTLSCGLTLN